MNQTEIAVVVPRAKTRPGLIARAKTFRLVLDSEALWIIHLGNAMGPKVKSNDILADKLAGVMVNRMEAKLMKELERVEASLIGMPLADQVKRKHSFRVPLSEGGAVTLQPNPHVAPRLIVKGAAGKAKLDGAEGDRVMFEAIADAFA